MFELALLVPADCAQSVADALIETEGALCASLEDADAPSEAEQPLYGEPGMTAQEAWVRSLVTALFAGEERATRAAMLLIAGDARIEPRALRRLPDEDWVLLTRSQFAPIAITPQFWIVPSWHEAPSTARTMIRLDPGLAFGTGAHPTTRMCLRWIARQAPRCERGWARVLDYGCGSGILAIAASLHGAAEVDAVDIDPAAVQTTLANARANAVRLNAGLPHAACDRYALVLANILAAPLELLAPLLCGHVAAGGTLVLAGMLERQAGALRDAYAPWCSLEIADCEGGWVLMSATPTAPSGIITA